jgi:hypothetical protein
VSRAASWWTLALLAVAVALLWSTWVVWPLKVLVVFFHEMGHGLAAVLTGGSVEEIQLVEREGGLAVTRGGNRFLILSAGYLGSLVAGGTILLLAARSRDDRAITATLGLVLLGVTLWLVRPWFGFGMLFGLASGLAFLAAAAWLGKAGNDLLLRLVGVVSCCYAILDVKSDVLDRPEARSDARLLAEHTGVPTVVWGVAWVLLAALATFLFVRAAVRTQVAVGELR